VLISGLKDFKTGENIMKTMQLFDNIAEFEFEPVRNNEQTRKLRHQVKYIFGDEIDVEAVAYASKRFRVLLDKIAENMGYGREGDGWAMNRFYM